MTIFKSNPYGQKSIQLSDSAFKKVSGVVHPFVATPYQYVSPYLRKADDLGDKTLSRVDSRFPVVKKPTDQLYNEARNLALTPYRFGLAGRDHVLSTYSAEKAKAGSDSAAAYSRVLVTTAVVVTSDAINTVRNFLAPKADAVAARARNAANGDEKRSN